MIAVLLPTLNDILKVLLGVGVAGTLGQWLGSRWQAARQARDEDLATRAILYDLYGRFFGTWKKWIDSGYVTADRGAAEARELLSDATAAEGEMEALLMRVATDRYLSDEHVRTLAALRQGYQRLRESISGGTRHSMAHWTCSWHEEYVAMKALATETAQLLAQPRTGVFALRVRRPSATDAKRAVFGITSNYYEIRWHEIGKAVAQDGALLPAWDLERFGSPCTASDREATPGR